MGFSTGFTLLFGCRYPLQQAGMGGFTSPDLAIAVSHAGGFGMLSGAIRNEALAARLCCVELGLVARVGVTTPFQFRWFRRVR